jgi:hypothetical protein
LIRKPANERAQPVVLVVLERRISYSPVPVWYGVETDKIIIIFFLH